MCLSAEKKIARLEKKVQRKEQSKHKKDTVWCPFCLAEMERSSCRFAATHLQNIVVPLRCRGAPCFVTRFCSLHPPPAALATLPLAGARVQISPQIQKGHRLVSFLSGGDGEILLPLRGYAPPKHSRPAPLSRCSLFCHSLLLASSAPGGARNAPSRGRSRSNLSANTKRTPFGVLFVWRRWRDLNSRAGNTDLHP